MQCESINSDIYRNFIHYETKRRAFFMLVKHTHTHTEKKTKQSSWATARVRARAISVRSHSVFQAKSQIKCSKRLKRHFCLIFVGIHNVELIHRRYWPSVILFFRSKWEKTIHSASQSYANKFLLLVVSFVSNSFTFFLVFFFLNT